MRRSSSASRLQKLGPAIGARLEQTKQFFAGSSQARSSSTGGVRRLVPEVGGCGGGELDETKPFAQSASASGLQKLGPVIGDRWDQFRRQLGKASGHRRHRSRSSSRPPLVPSWGAQKEEAPQPASGDGSTADGAAKVAESLGDRCSSLGEDEACHADSPAPRVPDALAGRGAAPAQGCLASWPRWFVGQEVRDFESLVRRVPQDVAAQIDKDVPRTQPRRLNREGRGALRRLLSAYAVLNPSVGYCQGMNNIAAVFVMLGFDEVAALRGLSTILQKACPGYHGQGLEGYLRDVAVLESIVRSGRILPPGVAARLDALEVPLDVLASEHFLSLAARSWPLEAVAAVWELFFREGVPAVFASFLALLQMYLPVEGAQEQSPGGALPGAVVDLEPVDVFRRAVQRGVDEDLGAILQRVRELIPKVPETLIAKLRSAQRGNGSAAVQLESALPTRHI